MTVSLRRMSAGSGYRYLLKSVVAGDGDRSLSTPLTRYYAEAATPPGRWLGSGLSTLGDGQLAAGARVTEEQLASLIGMGRDPITGKQLGRAYPVYKPLKDRIADRVGDLDLEMTLEDCASETAKIEAEETVAGTRSAVAGFDLTFSVPKSVSVLWGLADAPVQEQIVAAHHAAVADVIGFFEREVAATRTGFSDGDGAVAQVGVAGVVAAAFDHYDSRAGDPQLHTHVVVSNKVKTVLDGRWRSLDSRPVHASVTALSAHYNAVLADQLTRTLGVGWEQRGRGVDRNPQWEIAGIPEALIREFSSRSREIDLEKDRLISEYRQMHGRMPSEKKIVELRAQATLATRPPKELHSLADLTTGWRNRARPAAGQNPGEWATSLLARDTAGLVQLEKIPAGAINRVGSYVVGVVSEKRATWTHWNLIAEASRQTMHLRFASTSDREAVVELITEVAQEASVALTPPELASSPAEFRRPDGTSVFRPRHGVKYSSTAVIDAETRLLAKGETFGAPGVTAATMNRVGRKVDRISEEQRTAITAIATSGRQVDLLVGPAGAGKTTAMRALRKAWVHEHGRGSVIGLAPSAAAAAVLGGDLGTPCENTAKWLHEYNRRNPAYRLHPGQLVIIDEATLAGTATLDRLTSIAHNAGAKTLLVGDGHQLASVDAGGAFSLLVDRRLDTPELTEVHRFSHTWEKTASLALRKGQVEVISSYERHGRVKEGDTNEMLADAYEAWRADTAAGRASILVTESAGAVRALNERARAERILADKPTDAREISLAEGPAAVGDLVITRRNDRTLRTKTGAWVKNGDRWRITDINADGSIVLTSTDPRRGSTVLPADYVAEHLDLGYAITAHRAQGVTVDTAHVVVTNSTTRENLYVSMTRGRDANIAYVALDEPDDTHATPENDGVSARTVLYGVLRRVGDDLSAHQTADTENETYRSTARLIAEIETIASAAQRPRFETLLARSGLTQEQHAQAIASTGFGPLTAVLRRAEAYHHDLEQLLPQVVSQHALGDARDIAAVLTERLRSVADQPPRGARGKPPRLIAGGTPEPLGPMSHEARMAISQRMNLLDSISRASASHHQSISTRGPGCGTAAPRHELREDGMYRH